VQEWTKSGVSVHESMMLFQANLNEKLNLISKRTAAVESASPCPHTLSSP
jgi:hypothetical protein